MRRTQLYLDEDLWTILHTHARDSGVTISELVREAVRERYLGKHEERRKAMQAFIGIRKDSRDTTDSTAYIRALRRGSRLERLEKQ